MKILLHLDAQMLAQRKRRLVSAFESDPKELTDVNLDTYNILTARISELTKQEV